MSNLRLINETEVSSGVTTVNITDIFSADFDIYQIEFAGIYQSTNVSNGIEGNIDFFVHARPPNWGSTSNVAQK